MMTRYEYVWLLRTMSHPEMEAYWLSRRPFPVILLEVLRGDDPSMIG